VIVQRLTNAEAVDLVRHCLEEGKVILSKHFRDELSLETAELADAYSILKTGNIYDPPEPDLKTGEWKYRIEGRIVNGQWFAIVFKFRTEDSAFLITIFSIEKMNR
jgi:hypothetical protein